MVSALAGVAIFAPANVARAPAHHPEPAGRRRQAGAGGADGGLRDRRRGAGVPVALLPGLDLVLRADALSMLFATLSAVLWLVTTSMPSPTWSARPDRARFFGFFSLCVTATMGIAMAGNLLTFFIFYELLTLTTWPLVVHSGTRAGDSPARAATWPHAGRERGVPGRHGLAVRAGRAPGLHRRRHAGGGLGLSRCS
jgi:hypothetical protein